MNSCAEAVRAEGVPAGAVLGYGDAGHLLPVAAVPMDVMLARHCEKIGCTFVLSAKQLTASQVLTPQMFMPLVTWQAQDDGHRLLDADLGCALRVDPQTLFGLRSVVPHVTGHIVDVVRALFFLNAATRVLGLQPNSEIDLTTTHQSMSDHFSALLESVTQVNGDIPWPRPLSHPN